MEPGRLYVVQDAPMQADTDPGMSRLTPFLMVLALIVGIVGWHTTKPPEGGPGHDQGR
jgi:hypothetical protein